MKWSTVAFALGLGMALPCIFALAAIPARWVVADPFYASLLGVGFGVGLVLPIALDLITDWDDAQTRIRLDRARAWALEVETATREARLTAVAPVQPAAPAPPVDHWPQAAHRFLAAGNEHGFAIRVLVGKNVVTWEAWGQMVDVLVAAGVMVSRPRAGWAPGWDMARWTRERHSTPLPHDDTDPPTVALVSTTATKTTLTTPTTPLEQA